MLCCINEIGTKINTPAILVSEGKEAPVAKILNYGKLQYQKKKRQAQSARPVVKEVRFGLNIGVADYKLRIEQAVGWLSKGDSVKFAVRYREQAGELLDRVVSDLKSVGKVQSLDKRSLIALIIPA